MTIRSKTFVIISSTLVGVFLLLYLIANQILLSSFADLEGQKMQENFRRVLNSIHEDVEDARIGITDWAHWDDTYEFIQDSNQQYIDDNLTASAFATLHLDLMLFINQSGEIVFGKALDYLTGEELPVPETLNDYLKADSPLVYHTKADSIAGILMLPEGPLIIVSSPILTSLSEGPISGSLIWGRFLDELEISKLSEIIRLPIALQSFTDLLSADFAAAQGNLKNDGEAFITTINDTRLAGYGAVNDLYGQPALLLRVDMERDIYQRGQSAISYFLWALILVGVISSAASLIIMEKTVLSRLSGLNKAVKNIRTRSDFSLRVPASGSDEISSLAISINEMLNSIEESHNDLQALNSDLEARVLDRTESMRRSKENVEAILNNTSDAIILARGDGIIRQTNPAFDKLFGYNPDEMFSKSVFHLIKPEQLPMITETLKAIVADKLPRRLEITVYRKDGTVFDADVGLTAFMRIERQEPVVVCSLRDISQRKEMEGDLRRALQQEKELSEMKSRFTSLVSHEFRTPLTTILSSSQLLERHADKMDEERKRGHFEKINSQVRRLADMLDDVLALGKADVQREETQWTLLDLNVFCAGIVDEMQSVWSSTHKIVFNTDVESTPLNANEKLLRQMLTNLLSNAVKYSPEGGLVYLQLEQEEGQVFITVGDSGIGIPAEDQAHLFTEFHRAGNVGTISGTGLGLTIVKRAVELHHGAVTVESEVGKGTKFYIRLPMAQPQTVSGGSV